MGTLHDCLKRRGKSSRNRLSLVKGVYWSNWWRITERCDELNCSEHVCTDPLRLDA